MSESKFPLCKLAGLKLVDDYFPLFKASEVEKLLESAPVWEDGEYSARLVMIEPVVKESPERVLLREFVDHWEKEWVGKVPRDVFERAKALLDNK